MIDRDRFWRLLPQFHRRRDIETAGPLRALLEAFAEQAALLDADIARQYDNWFLETCEDWVVPYIGDVIGYHPVHGASGSDIGSPESAEALARHMAPRREVANTVRYRRRKGTLGLLEQLCLDVAGWPALAVESRHRVLATPHMRLTGAGQAHRGAVSLRRRTLDDLDSPADTVPRLAEMRRISAPNPGHHGPSQVALYVARHVAAPVTQVEAVCASGNGPHCFLLSALGIDVPLYRAGDPAARVLPGPLTLAALRDDPAVYGEGRSLAIWTEAGPDHVRSLIAADRIVPADLRHWALRPAPGRVALDPLRGRLMFPEGEAPFRVVSSTREGLFGDVGASERPRRLAPAGDRPIFTVCEQHERGAEQHRTLRGAINAWRRAQPADALIVIRDSATYDEEDLTIVLGAGQRLEIRAAERRRPLIRLSEHDASRFDAWRISGAADSALILDGLLISGNGLQLQGPLGALLLRHCSFVPGTAPRAAPAATAASLRIEGAVVALRVEHCALGSIHVRGDERHDDALALDIADSILDGGHQAAISGAEGPAYVALTIRRSTVVGRCSLHQLDVAEDCLFTRRLLVARRQHGSVRFCYLSHGSKTPRRLACVPADDAMRAETRGLPAPVFVSLQRGEPGYCQLAPLTAPDILRGASDQSEIGVNHGVFAPQRDTNLRARLSEYVPAAVEYGVIYVT
jgi:hypothetical protein